jgi:hypothetical protein
LAVYFWITSSTVCAEAEKKLKTTNARNTLFMFTDLNGECNLKLPTKTTQ